MAEGRTVKRAWQRMLSGRRLDILDPSPLDVDIGDVALGLSRLARWNGQTSGAHGYSVAQHSIMVAELVAASDEALPVQAVLAALLHDAAEAVVSDLVTPLKAAVGDAYGEIEEKVMRAIHVACGLPAELPATWRSAIRRADRAAAFAEAVHLAGFGFEDARQAMGFRGDPPDVSIEPWDAATAKRKFVDVFEDLRSGGRRCLAVWRSGRDTVKYKRVG